VRWIGGFCRFEINYLITLRSNWPVLIAKYFEIAFICSPYSDVNRYRFFGFPFRHAILGGSSMRQNQDF
jgi:hypothetical protein